MKKEIMIKAVSFLLIFLWTYAAASKLINYGQSRGQMMNQVFPVFISKFLVWSVPVTELLLVALLISRRWRVPGLLFSCLLLVLFTLYILLVMSNAFGRIPCSCGGIISKLSWGQHLIFNLVFLILALAGFIMSIKKGGDMGKA